MTSSTRLRSLSGIKPTGQPHWGNYFGMIQPAVKLAEDHEAFYFVADLHALTTVRDRVALQRDSLGITATMIACGLDPATSVLWRQSDVPEVLELMWLLGCVTSMGLMERAHGYKDAKAKGKDLGFGAFAYPVLMAADILLYDSDVVPVGKDQVQHLEMARDMATYFNMEFRTRGAELDERRKAVERLRERRFKLRNAPTFMDELTNGLRPDLVSQLRAALASQFRDEVKVSLKKIQTAQSIDRVVAGYLEEHLKLPRALVSPRSPVVPGLDGQKMSKSYDNYIAVFASQKELKKGVMAIKTDSKGLEEPKDPETCNVFALYKLFATKAQQAELAAKYRAGNFGYGHAKLELLALAEAHFGPKRARYDELMARPDDLLDILKHGAHQARAVARPVIERVRDATGLPTRAW